MSESQQIQSGNKPSDEIDLFDFFTRIWQAFKHFLIGIKNFLITILILVIQKFVWILSFALVGIIIGYFMYTNTRRYYSSFMEGNVEVENVVVIDHINKLNGITGNAGLLAGYLNIDKDEATNVKNIKAYYGIDVNRDKKPDYIDFTETYNPKDTNQLRVPNYIYLKVSVYNEEVFPSLRKGLLQYIKTNPYIQELHKIERKNKIQYINELGVEISKIDSLQRSQFRSNFKSEKGQLIIMGEKPETKLFYKDILLLHKQKQELEKELELSDDIMTIVQDFTPLSQEENPVKSYLLFTGAMMAIIGFICSLIWQYRRKIWSILCKEVN